MKNKHNSVICIPYIGKDRVQRVCKRLLKVEEEPVKNRGGDRKFAKKFIKKMVVINFKKRFKTKEVHNVHSKATRRQYLGVT